MKNFITARAVCLVSLTLLLCIIDSVHAAAQTDYYYFKGQKEPLYRNENKVCISIPKEYEGYLSALEADIPNILDIVAGKTPSGDGLSSPCHSSEGEEKTFNLAGQQVSGSHLPRALYIVGGRKTLLGH